MTSVEIEKQIRFGISRLTEQLDDMWLVLQNIPKGSTQYHINKASYDAKLGEITVLGGDWHRDGLGHHKVFLWGITAEPAKE